MDDYLTVEEVLAELNSMHQEIPDDCYLRLYDLISQLSDGKIGEKNEQKN